MVLLMVWWNGWLLTDGYFFPMQIWAKYKYMERWKYARMQIQIHQVQILIYNIEMDGCRLMATSSLGLIVVTGTNGDLGQIHIHGKIQICQDINTITQITNCNLQGWNGWMLMTAGYIFPRIDWCRSGPNTNTWKNGNTPGYKYNYTNYK